MSGAPSGPRDEVGRDCIHPGLVDAILRPGIGLRVLLESRCDSRRIGGAEVLKP